MTEDLIELAKQETFSHNKTPLRVAALYLIYSLYFKQPFRPKTRCVAKLAYTVVFGCNYQKKNVQKKISSESVRVLARPSEKPWFSQI